MTTLLTRARNYLTGSEGLSSSGYSGLAFQDTLDEKMFQPAEYGTYMATSTAVFVCIRLRTSNISSVPLRAYKLKGDGKRDLVTKGKMVELLNKVNPFWTFRRLVEITESSLGLWGEYYWFVNRGDSGLGTPKEIWGVRPDCVKVIADDEQYIKGYIYTPPNGGEPQPFRRSEVVRFYYPNPMDPRRGLSPLASIRLTADLARAATKSNAGIFRNGLQIGGLIGPKAGSNLTAAQAKELEEQITRRFKGTDKAHRWGVLRFEANFQPLTLSPKDMEFLGMQKWSLEEIARAYQIPQDLIGGQRTYENVKAAERGLWAQGLKPECDFLADELTEQFVPMFPGEADLLEFDLSKVEALQEAEGVKWQIAKEKIQAGVLIQNEYREGEGLDPVPWGDAWWAPINLTPVKDSELPEPPPPPADTDPNQDPEEDPEDATDPEQEDSTGTEDDERSKGSYGHRRIAYGSQEHYRIWQRAVTFTDPYENQFKRETIDLLRRQEQSVLDRLHARTVEAIATDPFDNAYWEKRFRVKGRTLIAQILVDSVEEDYSILGLDSIGISFNVEDPPVYRFIEQRAQRFAKEVNETTWERLRASFREGIQKGESISQIEDRVRTEFAERRSTAEVIARTEVMGAYNGGRLQGWRQSGVVSHKEWLAAMDARTRKTHVQAHNQQRSLEANFVVGTAEGPAPGSMGQAREDIQCRCIMYPILADDAAQELRKVKR